MIQNGGCCVPSPFAELQQARPDMSCTLRPLIDSTAATCVVVGADADLRPPPALPSAAACAATSLLARQFSLASPINLATS
jgi:hypothetical protein